MDTDLLIVGGGPAGCAAAVMAASVGMRSVLIESGDALCGALRRIPVVRNVLTVTNGPDLAAAIEADLAQCDLCRVELGRRATLIDAFDDRVEVTVEPAESVESVEPRETLEAAGSDRAPRSRLTAPYVVVATGVGPLGPEGAGWLGGAAGRALPQLWEADPAAIDDRTVLVLGADRPLGTVARAHPELKARFVVAYPPEDSYKTEEIRRDPRVELVAVRRLELGPGPGSASAPVTAEAGTLGGERRTLTADLVFLNLGSAPAPPAGAVATDRSGYCPPGSQHPRVFTAGDLRSVRFQRIATAMGSGGEAALGAYYASRGLPVETGGPPTDVGGPPGPTGGG
ncbi:FAD-dependent oxidoreductase [Streptomyces rapamycinicus]|uniref:FAD-dependent pyridine nucleotide-disulfide oxidoreductase n=2 Tax=Streptomyces rapamycinicus TaxID=1226757 RepID=A0A0A0NE86_STRRN|nr:FAD-dependent oxidoreductase [Streptomyces rapamycinicus]AGP55546.1 FAD-dependent pyridine nucleotide-disulfide oxidoreductase [Streptomyces rapamycinicus NRRL 5491]MBB4783107.1 thioredoxin reductase (NADPH)/alkyl hydroperoxide reductase subunit F [Streptomyces rapamycinicus]RLV81419.1 FAD-dependent pyridine nucleotide-disulfide oxidoreductase [Streptomyces rapamycinicus NRRL 5491]UTO63546.1 FAD-dependent oxidoreductase [Streptomyces rapamycinicus]UTP31502.1 FAD-dependent oxidoreductase [St